MRIYKCKIAQEGFAVGQAVLHGRIESNPARLIAYDRCSGSLLGANELSRSEPGKFIDEISNSEQRECADETASTEQKVCADEMSGTSQKDCANETAGSEQKGCANISKVSDQGSCGGTDCCEEEARLQGAIEELEQRFLKRDKEAGHRGDREQDDLFEAETLLLRDDSYTGYAFKLISEQGLSAVKAIRVANDRVCSILGSGEDPLIRERCDDIRGITNVLTDLLDPELETLEIPDRPFILFAFSLSPAELMKYTTDHLKGIVTVNGSDTSHVAVLAGNLGIPYFYGINESILNNKEMSVSETVNNGDWVIMDSQREELMIDPDSVTLQEALKRQEENDTISEKPGIQTGFDNAARQFSREHELKTGIFANISGLGELDKAVASGVDGIGLCRSEFLFMDRKCPPEEEELLQAYSRLARAMSPREVTIRTMDLGSDKNVRWLNFDKEPNPALGKRGLRLSLSDRMTFRTELRALLRASVCGNIKIMVPMVTSDWELDQVRDELKNAARELESSGLEYRVPPLGIMIETPAAALMADRLALKADFFSIGTNDLAQYTLALDREAVGLDEYKDPMHEAVFRLIDMTVKAAHEKGIKVSVCGELAGNIRATDRLVELGVDSLSVSISKVSEIYKKVRLIEEGMR